MAERSNALPWKGSYVETHTGVRIPHSPPDYPEMRSIDLYLFIIFLLFLSSTIVEGNESELVILQAKQIISMETGEQYQNKGHMPAKE